MTPSARRDESATDPAGMTGGQVDAVSVLTDALKAAGAKDVLDVGCGDGGIARALSRRGFTVTGIDPSAAAVARATQRVPAARFLCARAEELPAGLPPSTPRSSSTRCITSPRRPCPPHCCTPPPSCARAGGWW